MAKQTQQWSASTVVALRIGVDDFYHGGCAPKEAEPYTLGDETDIYNPEIVWRHCLECGKPIIGKRAHRDAIHDYFWQECQKHVDDEE